MDPFNETWCPWNLNLNPEPFHLNPGNYMWPTHETSFTYEAPNLDPIPRYTYDDPCAGDTLWLNTLMNFCLAEISIISDEEKSLQANSTNNNSSSGGGQGETCKNKFERENLDNVSQHKMVTWPWINSSNPVVEWKVSYFNMSHTVLGTPRATSTPKTVPRINTLRKLQ